MNILHARKRSDTTPVESERSREGVPRRADRMRIPHLANMPANAQTLRPSSLSALRRGNICTVFSIFY